jgi:restriction system protein
VAVPGFQTWFMPLLRRLGDDAQHAIADLYGQLADDTKLSSEDRATLLTSGKQAVNVNRIGWARTYLKKAGLISSPARGVLRITPRGQGVLAQPPANLNVKYLRQFPEFVEFHTFKGVEAQPGADAPTDQSEETPIETLERVHGELESSLGAELLERIKAASPTFFEHLVVDLLLAMGYGGSREDAGKTIGKSGDGGLDGVISEDKLGLDVIYVQAKRWENSVGRPVVQAFAGSLEGVRARKGVLITTSSFTSDAKEYIRHIEKKIVLIDGPTLATLLIQHDVAVTVESSYSVKKMDQDYFDE